MANPIDSSQDDSFQIDPLLGSDSFLFTGNNQTHLPIQPSEQAEQTPVVLNQIPSSELDPICDEVEAVVLNPIPSSKLDPICDEVEALSLNPIPSSEADLISGQESLVLNPISSSEPNPICGEVVQAPEQPLKLYPVPKALLRSIGLNMWTMTSETQNSGASAGNIDRYYVDPKTGQRFRSKAEVQRYLNTGSKSKPHSSANAKPSKTSGKDKEKSGSKGKEKSGSKDKEKSDCEDKEKSGSEKTDTKKEKEAGWNFDFENPPEETTWSLVDGAWKPSIGGEPVPEETVQQWAETFELGDTDGIGSYSVISMIQTGLNLIPSLAKMGKDGIRYPGFKFSPTEEELILYYLRRKLDGFQKCVRVIAEIDINQHEPWDLPEKSVIWSANEWFFFSTRAKKYSKGSQSRRTTESGYWKATGRERNVKSGTRVIGTKRTLVFHKGRPPKGERTEWIMHEYCMIGVPQESLIICRVRKIGEFKDYYIPQQLDQAGESSDLQQKDTYDGLIFDDGENRDKFQGLKKGCSNPDSVECNDSEYEYGQKPENLIFYDESCSSPKFQGNDGVTNDCFASILDDDSIKFHGSSLSSSYADISRNDTIKYSSSDYKLEQLSDSVPLVTQPFHEIENVGIRVRQRQQQTESIPSVTLPSQGTANRRIRLNYRHKRKPCNAADELPPDLTTPPLDLSVNHCHIMIFLFLGLLVLSLWVLI